MNCIFFFQAEDGIRDLTVTGVQTCALPISPSPVLIVFDQVHTPLICSPFWKRDRKSTRLNSSHSQISYAVFCLKKKKKKKKIYKYKIKPNTRLLNTHKISSNLYRSVERSCT